MYGIGLEPAMELSAQGLLAKILNARTTRLASKSRHVQSTAIKRRSTCDSVRGCPVLSSHFSPRPGPLQVGPFESEFLGLDDRMM